MDLNRKETLKAIEEHEYNGDFNAHLNPIDWNKCYPVYGNFKYYHNGFITSLKYFFFHL